MGGMVVFILSRKDENVNKMVFDKVRQDKEREVVDGFDGIWVVYFDFVFFVKEIFMKVGLICLILYISQIFFRKCYLVIKNQVVLCNEMVWD